MWVDSTGPECSVKELGLLLVCNGNPLQALRRAAMIGFCVRKTHSSTVLSKLDGDQSEDRETGCHCGYLRGFSGGVGAGEKGRIQCGQEEGTRGRVDKLALVFRTSTPCHLCLAEL